MFQTFFPVTIPWLVIVQKPNFTPFASLPLGEALRGLTGIFNGRRRGVSRTISRREKFCSFHFHLNVFIAWSTNSPHKLDRKGAKLWKNLYKAEIWYSGLVKCPKQHTKSPSESGAGVVPPGAKMEPQNSLWLTRKWIKCELHRWHGSSNVTNCLLLIVHLKLGANLDQDQFDKLLWDVKAECKNSWRDLREKKAKKITILENEQKRPSANQVG